MGKLEIVIIAFGLAFDAFAVSIGAGAGKRINNHRGALRLSFHLGLFQFLMPVLGWYMGYNLEPLVKSIDHWIAFLLLLYVGVKMVRSSFGLEKSTIIDPSKGKYLVMLSVATSIDALIVGFSLAMLRAEIWYPSIIIGIITAILSILGIYSGKALGLKFGKKMEFAGGLVLVLIGFKILISF